jgi:hypothetical protein
MLKSNYIQMKTKETATPLPHQSLGRWLMESKKREQEKMKKEYQENIALQNIFKNLEEKM